MAVDVWDEDGLPLAAGQGRAGLHQALPLDAARLLGRRRRQPLPGRVLRALPGVWAHGDFASWTEHDGMVIYGRSDATLNASGVRIGTAEIYRQVEQLPEVAEAVAVGQEWDGDTRIVLFVRLAEGASARRRPRRHDPSHAPGALLAPPRAGRASPRSPTSPAPAAARSPSWPSPTSSTAGRCATPRRSPTPRRSSSSAIAPSWRPDAQTGSADRLGGRRPWLRRTGSGDRHSGSRRRAEARAGTGVGHPAGHRSSDQLSQEGAGLEQALDVDARRDAEVVEEGHGVLGGHVAGGAGGERRATDPADAGVEPPDARAAGRRRGSPDPWPWSRGDGGRRRHR